MQQHTNRLRWAVLPVALRTVGAVMLCIAALSFLAFHAAPRAKATGLIRMITGTISSSPYSGPAGTTITVSGSGWGGTNGTPVSFGYQVYSNCQIVADSQSGSLEGGSFSGWFRWPSGTALNTYQVCAMLGSVMEVAGSFTVLSSSPPSVAVAPATLAPNTHATITASNYYPAGTPVNFLWMSGNTVIKNLGSVASNTSGQSILSFSVPKLSIGNGPYTIDATTGGQPAALFSSSNFTYSAPTASPSPTPQPSPSPSPTVTPSVTPTTTPTASATATTTTTATPITGASPTAGTSQTPTTNGTNSRNTGTPTASSSNNALLIGGVAILFGALLAGVVAILLLRRRRKAAPAVANALPPRMPDGFGQPSMLNPQNPPGFLANSGAMPFPPNGSQPGFSGQPGVSNPASYPQYAPVAGPGMFGPQPGNMPSMPVTPAPVPVGAGAMSGNGNFNTSAAMPPIPVSPQPPISQQAPVSQQPYMSQQPPAWLTNASPIGSAPAAGGNAPPTMAIPADPALDAMRRQAQSGLFVSPRPFNDGSSQ